MERSQLSTNGPDNQILHTAYGLPVATSSPACVDLINEYTSQVLSYRSDMRAALRAVEADPRCVLAKAIAATYSLGKTQGRQSAQFYLEQAQELVKEGCGTAYEHAVLASIEAWAGRQEDVIVDTHLKLVQEWPRDLLAVKRGQTLAFYLGRQDIMLQLAEQACKANSNAPYIDGMLAFALLEASRFQEAEEAALRGLSVSSEDVWAQHALCHVLYQECRFQELLEYVDVWQMHWEGKSPFMYIHSWWHVALCHLDKGGAASINAVLDIYDRHITGRDETGVEDCLNGLGLLLRLQLRGHGGPVRQRLGAVVDRLSDKDMWHLEKLLDLFTVWAFAYMASPEAQKTPSPRWQPFHLTKLQSPKQLRSVITAQSPRQSQTDVPLASPLPPKAPQTPKKDPSTASSLSDSESSLVGSLSLQARAHSQGDRPVGLPQTDTCKAQKNRVTIEIPEETTSEQESLSESLLESMRGVVARMPEGRRQQALEAGWLVLGGALDAFGRGDYTEACDRLDQVQWDKLKVIAASDEQLDVFYELHCVALLHGGRLEEAVSRLELRSQARSGVPYTHHMLALAYEKLGKPRQANDAKRRASDPGMRGLGQ